MTQQDLEGFLKENKAFIGAQLYFNTDTNICISGVSAGDKRWLVVSHGPECYGPRYITHLETCESVADIFQKSEGVAKDIETYPEKYMSQADHF
jgi:hypothetical protein